MYIRCEKKFYDKSKWLFYRDCDDDSFASCTPQQTQSKYVVKPNDIQVFVRPLRPPNNEINANHPIKPYHNPVVVENITCNERQIKMS
mmetsp:Transcript_7860/g.9832  ORF Transcript_7860/g.9832 Transcript_7860/m.9832 type:complete len:88 (-) Transcript_7860:1148-1411(-)